MALTAPQHKYRCLFQILSSFFCCNQHTTSAIAHDTAIQQVQRLSNHTGVEYILPPTRLPVHCIRVQTSIPAIYTRTTTQSLQAAPLRTPLPPTPPPRPL